VAVGEARPTRKPNRDPTGRSRTARRARGQTATRRSVAARLAERSFCIDAGSCQQSEGTTKRAQTPLRALACFVPASLCDQARTLYRAVQQLFLPIGKPYSSQRPAQHGIAVDRCAREIGAFLKARSSALAATECQTVGRVRCSAFTNASHGGAANGARTRLGRSPVADTTHRDRSERDHVTIIVAITSAPMRWKADGGPSLPPSRLVY